MTYNELKYWLSQMTDEDLSQPVKVRVVDIDQTTVRHLPSIGLGRDPTLGLYINTVDQTTMDAAMVYCGNSYDSVKAAKAEQAKLRRKFIRGTLYLIVVASMMVYVHYHP